MIELKTKSELFGGTYVVSVTGELDLYSAPQLHSELTSLQPEQVRSVIVDLTECEFIDSTALGVLVKANKRLSTENVRLSLITADRNIRRIFEITGFDSVLTISPSRAVAMNGGLSVA